MQLPCEEKPHGHVWIWSGKSKKEKGGEEKIDYIFVGALPLACRVLSRADQSYTI